MLYLYLSSDMMCKQWFHLSIAAKNAQQFHCALRFFEAYLRYTHTHKHKQKHKHKHKHVQQQHTHTHTHAHTFLSCLVLGLFVCMIVCVLICAYVCVLICALCALCV